MDGIWSRTCAAVALALLAGLCAAAPALATDGYVKGKKWHDANANGQWDSGEKAVANWWIYVDVDRDGVHDAGEPAAKTDANGYYSITGIKWWVPNHEPRTYDVREKPASQQPDPTLDGCSYPAYCKHTLTFKYSQHQFTNKNFGNYKKQGKIVVKKVNVGGDQSDAFSFTTTGAGLSDFQLAASDAPKAFGSLTPGTYSVAETADPDYTLTSATCDDGSAPSAIKLDAGETVTCTFTNTRKTGTIKVVKALIPATDAGRFDLQVGDDVVADGVGDGGAGEKVVPSGTYTVGEAADGDHDLGDYLSSVACDDGTAASGPSADVTVAGGETVTCTITNTRKADVTVTKTEGGSTTLTRNWTFVLSGGPDQVEITRATGDGGNPMDFGTLAPGAYTLCEIDLPAGWMSSLGAAVDGKVCVDLTLEPGESEAVAVDNTAPAIQLVKEVRRAGDAAWAKTATLQVGQTAQYLLTVTNEGVGPLVDVDVADDRCDAEPAYVGGDEDGDSKLDEDETWTYRCDHVVAAADGAKYVNTAEATATDERGNPVRDTDTATVTVTTPPTNPPKNPPKNPPVTPPTTTPPTSQPDGDGGVAPEEVISGAARLRGPSGCVSRRFTATVRGRQIRRVTFFVDGRKVKTVKAKRGQRVFKLGVTPTRYGQGIHRVNARVVFRAASATKAKTLRLTFRRCGRQVLGPRFTG